MPRKAILLICIAAMILSSIALSAVLFGRLETPPEVTKTIAAGAGATASVIYATSFPDLHGQQQSLGQWSNKLLVINFWATWCAPCLDEIPIFVRLQNKYSGKGLQIVGIAADSPLNSSKFAEKLKINYPVLPDEIHAIEFSKRAGNRFDLLPYTIVLNARGDIVLTKLGIVAEAEFTKLIENNLPH